MKSFCYPQLPGDELRGFAPIGIFAARRLLKIQTSSAFISHFSLVPSFHYSTLMKPHPSEVKSKRVPPSPKPLPHFISVSLSASGYPKWSSAWPRSSQISSTASMPAENLIILSGMDSISRVGSSWEKYWDE